MCCLLDDLRRHPEHRTLQRRPVCTISGQRLHVHFFGDTKVRDLDTTLIIDKDVGSLDIPMDDPSFVKVFKTLEDLTDEILDKGLLECTVIAQKSGD